jgi:penicillin-binding protein 1A
LSQSRPRNASTRTRSRARTGTRTRSAPASRTSKRARPVWRRIRWKRVLLLGFGVLAFFYTLIIGALFVFGHVPQPNEIARAQSVNVVDHDGHAIGRIHAAADRVSVPFAEMPLDLRHAVIATEDRHFYQHHGIRFTSILRAAFANVLHRGVAQGGSTITQQYVKNAFVGNERSLWRKTKEAVLAVKLERKESKDDILRDYLNTIYFGRGAYGCEAAAQAYFASHCRKLTLAQSAMLAGIIQAPELYDPSRDEERARGRRAAVLNFMRRDGYVTEEQRAQATDAPLKAHGRAAGGIAPHFIEQLRRQLEDRYGARRLYSGQITRVVATLDRDMQTAAETAVRTVYPYGNDPEAALVAIDPHTGAVRALVGSRDFSKTELNLAVDGRRQPGSTFKPVVLAKWIDQGRSINDTFAGPSSISIAGQHISNYQGESFGNITVEHATWNSVNTVFAQLIFKEGASKAVEMAHDLGIESKLVPQVGLTLGDQDVTPLELANLYATLAARGERHKPFFFERVIGANGKVLFRAGSTGEQTVKRNVADTVNYVLQGVVQNGTGRPAQLGRPAAGKTGTTENHADAWFAGYTPELATVVWTGYPRGQVPLRNVRGVIGGAKRTIDQVYGGSFPAAMWKEFMQKALSGLPSTSFATPSITGASPTATPSPSSTPTPSPSPSPTGVRTTLPPPPSASPKPSPTKKPRPSHSPTPSPSASPSST